MPTTYLEFADLFSRLSPYELDHFSEVLLCKLEASAEGQYLNQQKQLLCEKDIKTALTESMRDIAIITRERQLSVANLELNNAKALIFTMPLAKVA